MVITCLFVSYTNTCPCTCLFMPFFWMKFIELDCQPLEFQVLMTILFSFLGILQHSSLLSCILWSQDGEKFSVVCNFMQLEGKVLISCILFLKHFSLSAFQDPRAVLIGLLLVLSGFQYLNQWTRYNQVSCYRDNM